MTAGRNGKDVGFKNETESSLNESGSVQLWKIWRIKTNMNAAENRLVLLSNGCKVHVIASIAVLIFINRNHKIIMAIFL